jgi:pimeloyl-ACP methyl ester carboxylesterase
VIVCLHGFMDSPRTWDLARPALVLAARGRADSVVALAPAGGWDDDSYP